MVKLDYLDPFITFRTRPPMIAPENSKNRKKNQAYIVIAPSMESELSYLSSTTDLKFRNLTKFFIDKKIELTLYRSGGRKIIKPTEDGTVDELLAKYKKGNLSRITGVTSYLANSKAKPLRDLNVLVEMSYLTDMYLNNKNDTRLMKMRIKDWANEFRRVYESAIPTGYLGNYKVSVFIPLELWLSPSDLSSFSALTRPASKSFIGQLLLLLCNQSFLSQYEHAVFYLLYHNTVMILDPNQLSAIQSQDSKSTTAIYDLMRTFFVKAKQQRVSTEELYDQGDLDDSDTTVNTTHSEEKLKKAEDETKVDIVTDAVLEKSKVDPDKVTPEAKESVRKVVTKEIVPNITLDNIDADANVELPKELTIKDPEDVDIMLAAKMSGQSVESYKRNEMLKEKYHELKIGDVPLDSLMKEEEMYAIPEKKIPARVINDSMKTIKSERMEEAYNSELALRDLTNILMHFSHAKPAMYINKDIKVEDVSTPTDRILAYTVEFEDETRKRHRFTFKLPKMYKDKYFYLNDQQMNLSHQKLPFPVTKIGPDKCQAVTNYKKIISDRYGLNLSPVITRIKKLFTGPNCPKFITATKGNAVTLNTHYLTTVEYDDISSAVVRVQLLGSANDKLQIYFIVDEARAVVDTTALMKLKIENEKPENMIPLGVRTIRKSGSIEKTYYYLSGTSNKVYDQKGTTYGELSEFIISVMEIYDPKIRDTFSDISVGTKFIYSRSKVLDEYMPMILLLAAADPGGLIAVLDKAKINYRFTENRTHNKDTEGIFAFSDGYLIYDRYPLENSLLMNGLAIFPTKEFAFHSMNTRDTYVEIFDLLYNRRRIADGLRNFYYMFVDPITADVLIRLKMPTDFTRLMLYCNDVLADNTFQIDSDYHNSRIRSNEIVYAYLYRELAEAWGRYKDGREEKFSIPADAVIKTLLTANIVDPHSELNMTLETEADRQVKLKGPSGMNEDHSFTLEKRAYHPSMAGIVGMNSTPSGEVGIARHMTLNANIVDARGFLETDKKEYDGTELTTPGELLQAFAPESADIERVAMSISQSKHVLPVANGVSSPVSYDMERVMPYLSTDFARSAKKNGKVISIENDLMIIQYDDGTTDDIDLSERPAKNTDGGFYIINSMKTDLKPGARIKEGQLLAYDPKYINNHDFFGETLATTGAMGRVAIETNGGVYEDGCFITENLANRMKTRITRQKRVILSKYANIKHIVKIGDEIRVNQPILTFDDTKDEFSSQMLAAMAQDAEDSDEVVATSTPILSSITGVVKDIRIYYVSPISEMTPSLQKLIKDYIAANKKREDTLNKYMGEYNANTIVKTTQQLTPDSMGKVKGVKIEEGLFIDFYLEYEDKMGVGDKLSYYTALKGVVSDVIPEELAAYTESNPDRKIDACLSCIGVYKRMCLDVCKVGMMNKIVIEKKRKLKEAYLDKLIAEDK